MQVRIHLFFLIFTVTLLAACSKQPTYSDLIQDPAHLKNELAYCETAPLSGRDISRCKMVIYAAKQVVSFVNEAQEDPEKFGQRLLDAQTALVQLQSAVDAARQKVHALERTHASEIDIQTAKKMLKKVREQYKEREQEVNLMLAVIGLGSPE